MTTTSKLYTGFIGWSGNAIHAVRVNELEDGSGYQGEPYAICKPNTGYHYRIGQVRLPRKHTDATEENVTCKECKKRMNGGQK